MMFSRRFLLCCTMLILYTTHTTKGQWLSRPANLSLCEGDNAVLNWNYADNPDVSMIFWIFMGTGQTMMAWYDANDQTKVYPDHSGRVRMINGTKAGIILHNVTKSDSGDYQIEVAGPGWRDVAHLDVYTDQDLVPHISVDGFKENITEGKIVNLSQQNRATIIVHMPYYLLSNISVHAGGSNRKLCTGQKSCTVNLDFHDYSDHNIAVEVRTSYENCGDHELTFFLLTRKKVNKTPIIIGVIIPVILLTITILISLGFAFRKRQHQSTCQKRYLDLLCFNKFTNMRKRRNVKNSRTDENPVEGVITTDPTEDDPEQEPLAASQHPEEGKDDEKCSIAKTEITAIEEDCEAIIESKPSEESCNVQLDSEENSDNEIDAIPQSSKDTPKDPDKSGFWYSAKKFFLG